MSSQTRERPWVSPSRPLSEIGRSPARYLLAISELSDAGEGRIETGELRAHLDVSPASVTEMASKLDDRGLVDYQTYQGVTLTPQGDALAAQIAWRFCIVSTYFDSVLDADLDERTAFDIAFTLSKDGVCGLRDLVNSPCLNRCPESTGKYDEWAT